MRSSDSVLDFDEPVLHRGIGQYDSFLESLLSDTVSTSLLPDVDMLAEVLQPNDVDLPANNQSFASLVSLRANWNQFVCTAHRLQLSVKAVLNLNCISIPLALVRQTVRFFRRSSSASSYLAKAFKQSREFKLPLRPLLDVKTRWGSTIAMIKRYLRIEAVLSDATTAMMRDGAHLGSSGPADPLLPRQKALLEILTTVLVDAEASTAHLGNSHDATTQHVEVCCAGIVQQLDEIRSAHTADDDILCLTDRLKTDLLRRRVQLFKTCPMAELFCQVSTFLTPHCKTMKHLRVFSDDDYRYSIEKATFFMYHVSLLFMPTHPQPEEISDNLINNTENGEVRQAKRTRAERMMSSLFEHDAGNSEVDPESALRTKVKCYSANAKEDLHSSPLAFWRKSEHFYPRLANVARLVFTPSACSTESERLFSTSSILRSQRRAQLTGENTELIIKAGSYLRQQYAKHLE